MSVTEPMYRSFRFLKIIQMILAKSIIHKIIFLNVSFRICTWKHVAEQKF